MKIWRIYADEQGDTHLTPILLPEIAGALRRRELLGIPTTTLELTELLGDGPIDMALHRAPRRQLVLILKGQVEITTTTGDRQRFGAGEGFIAEDLEGKGHTARQVSDQQLSYLNLGIDRLWKVPAV